MSRLWQTTLLALVAVAVIAASAWTIDAHQRAGLMGVAAQDELADDARGAFFAAELELTAFGASGTQGHLIAARSHIQDFAGILGELRESSSPDDTEIHHRLDEVAGTVERWHAAVDDLILLGNARTTQEAVRRSRVAGRARAVADFRREITALNGLVDARRDTMLDRAGPMDVGILLVLCSFFAATAWLFTTRRERRLAVLRAQEERLSREGAELGQTLQAMDREDDAHAVVKRHLERAIPEATVTVLSRNPAEARLEARTPVAPGPFADALVDAEPRSCMALRLGRTYASDANPLLECELCGKTGSADTMCTPLVVSGEMIGTVLVEHDAPLDDVELRTVASAVGRAAPVVGNIRTLAMAEARAATDPLTGLPNRRAIQENLKRMVALSARTMAPMAALALDLDHFKDINDRYGHEKGDEVLAAVGAVLGRAVRESDFVGRNGGEEFLVLAPGVDGEAAVALADKVRAAVARIEVAGVDRAITTSVGVATFPLDAVEPDALLRKADRALFAAKRGGRDRVEAAADMAADTPFAGA